METWKTRLEKALEVNNERLDDVIAATHNESDMERIGLDEQITVWTRRHVYVTHHSYANHLLSIRTMPEFEKSVEYWR